MPDNPFLQLDGDIPFGRSRLLRGLGAALFSYVIASSDNARGDCSGCLTSPCGGASQCPSCNTSTGACPGCVAQTGICPGAGANGHCWCTCSGGTAYVCCDYEYQMTNGLWEPCTCNETVGSPC